MYEKQYNLFSYLNYVLNLDLLIQPTVIVPLPIIVIPFTIMIQPTDRILFYLHLSSFSCSLPHLFNSFNAGSNSLPLSVKEYSTLGGIVSY